MRLVLLVVTGCLAYGGLACGSDDSPGGGGGASGMATSTAGKNSSGGPSAGGSTGGSNSHAGTTSATAGSATAGSATAGSSSGGASGLSPACQKFCDCHDANCGTLAIPDGKSCADFCEAMTEDQLACRQNMCKLVPDQPDNDHCKHSLGIDQCL